MIKFFTASWCTPCSILKNNLSVEDLEGVILVDVDTQRGEVDKYGVKSVPTLIKFGEDGEELNRLSGSMTRDQFLGFKGG